MHISCNTSYTCIGHYTSFKATKLYAIWKWRSGMSPKEITSNNV